MEYKLEKLLDSVSIRHPFSKKNVVFLNTSDIEEGNILKKEYSKIDDLPGQAKKSIQPNDILYSEIRPKNKRYAYINFECDDYVVSTKLMVLRNINPDLVHSKYLYYFLIDQKTVNYLQNIAESRSGTFPQITFSEVKNLKLDLPSIEKQITIINIMDTLNEKINNNKKIIANLEELSQTLFKRWFVDFEFPDENGNPYKSSGREMTDSELGEIPIDWKVFKIIELDAIVSDHVANGSFKTLKENVEFVNEDIKNNAIFVRNIDLKKQDFRPEKYVSNETYKFLKKTHLHGHELIISNVGDVGSVHLCPKVDKNMVLGNNQIFFKHNIDKKWNYYLYLYFKSGVGKQLINKITSGSVQMKFNKTDFRNLQIVIPTQKILDDKFGNIIDFLNLIEEKKYENKRLIELRDTLLPKLMSGELEIPDDIEVNSDELSI
ncbi:restriction endonuclease subunit S [Staphylococcus hominis]|uniref:restriction endonuclease subunit S n=1 Tax=Staphylococcus hominis TaxID=1290 RepID=UPI001F592068|nr:restriction endonuclease subunit S [Staphylococcus hominis]MCI2871115.1 restriction endonuclease subunit S [Staphylococcus hominis]MCI2875363.1 restriction endonuclease subunit S [Staphylococcus hominis]